MSQENHDQTTDTDKRSYKITKNVYTLPSVLCL